MRLWFSVAALLILTCVILEASAAKSNRNTDATKDKQKSINAKEVRYTKNKSDYKKKKGNGKDEKSVKEKKQRYNVEENKKIESNENLKQNRNGRNGEAPHVEQKRQKFDKQNKIDKNSHNIKNNKHTVKVTKDEAKTQKRSLEFEQPKESLVDDVTKNEDLKLNSGSKKLAKNKFEKISRDGAGNARNNEPEGEAIVNIEEELQKPPSISTRKSEKNKIEKEQRGNSKKIKKQKSDGESEASCNANVKSRKSESKKEKIQTSEEPAKLATSEYSNDSSASSYYLNEDGLIKEKKSENIKVKKQKLSKKSSETVSECNDRDTEQNEKLDSDQRSDTHKSSDCNLDAECPTDQNTKHTEKSKYFTELNNVKSNVADIEEDETEDKA